MKKYTIGIIGGTGSMGQWFKTFFTEAGHTVIVSGRKTAVTLKDLADQCHIVILSTPFDAAMNLCEKVGPLLSENQLLMDFCSLKEKIVHKMAECTNASVIGTHPMFGPCTESIRGRNFIICPVNETDWIKWLEDFLRNQGAIVTKMDAVDHDRKVAVVQGLTHFLTICMGKTLQQLDMPPDSIKTCSTPIFRLNMDLLGRLFSQDLDLYSNLVGKNEYVKEAFEIFSTVLDEAKDLLILGNKGDKLSYLEDIRNFMGDFCETGFNESNKILNGLYLNNK